MPRSVVLALGAILWSTVFVVVVWRALAGELWVDAGMFAGFVAALVVFRVRDARRTSNVPVVANS